MVWLLTSAKDVIAVLLMTFLLQLKVDSKLSLRHCDFCFLWVGVGVLRLLANNLQLATLPTNMRCVLNVGLEGLRIVFHLLLFVPHEGMYIYYNFYLGYHRSTRVLRSSKTYKSMLIYGFPSNANNVHDNRFKTY